MSVARSPDHDQSIPRPRSGRRRAGGRPIAEAREYIRVAAAWGIGLRGSCVAPQACPTANWPGMSASFARKTIDDIVNVSNTTVLGIGFFLNTANTLRQGVQTDVPTASLQGRHRIALARLGRSASMSMLSTASLQPRRRGQPESKAPPHTYHKNVERLALVRNLFNWQYRSILRPGSVPASLAVANSRTYHGFHIFSFHEGGRRASFDMPAIQRS
jgi:hypothetical protein